MSIKINKKEIGSLIIDFVMINFGALIAAAAIFFFMLPSNLAIGSGTALAMVLSNFINLPVSVLSLIINIVLLILGFIIIGPEFGIKTVYSATMVPVFLGIFEIAFGEDFKSLTEDPLIDMICYILVVGVGMAILFARNASSGGLDIVAKIMNKYLNMELGYAMSISGILVAMSSIFVKEYDTKTVILSVVGTYFCGMMLDYFIFGFGLKRKVCIISKDIDVFLDYILNDLHSGATVYEYYGPYNKTSGKEVVAIVDKHEYRKLMDFIKKTDPKAFVTVYSVNSIQYQPKITTR